MSKTTMVLGSTMSTKNSYARVGDFRLHQTRMTEKELIAIRPSYDATAADTMFKRPAPARFGDKRCPRITNAERQLLAEYRAKNNYVQKRRKIQKQTDVQASEGVLHQLSPSHIANSVSLQDLESVMALIDQVEGGDNPENQGVAMPERKQSSSQLPGSTIPHLIDLTIPSPFPSVSTDPHSAEVSKTEPSASHNISTNQSRHNLLLSKEELIAIRPGLAPTVADITFMRPGQPADDLSKRRILISESERALLYALRASNSKGLKGSSTKGKSKSKLKM